VHIVLPFTDIYIGSSSFHYNTFYVLSPNKLKLDENYLTGPIPSEVMTLATFDSSIVGEFMLQLF
jgi:hypothetical protein